MKQKQILRASITGYLPETCAMPPSAEALQILTDPHLPNFIRVSSVVQQFPQFHEAYGAAKGDGMFRAPEDRARVW
ncbi:MAG: hypothetical protein K6C12_08850 [Oscillospiraceae bacterium]|nr:hypothetical protein [Oscillospiraceae bacterium]